MTGQKTIGSPALPARLVGMIDDSIASTTNASPANPDMPAGDFRRHGKALIDWVASYLEDPRKYPVLARVRPGDLRDRLPRAAPVQGEPMEEILRDFDSLVMLMVTHWNHPRFFAYFPNTASEPGILGEMLIAALNVNAMLWRTSPAATELEQVVLGWVAQLLGLPESWFGHIEDTASTSTMSANISGLIWAAQPVTTIRLPGRSRLSLRIDCRACATA